ncbi:MAG TPA: hypothetical protein VF551_01870, partial [Chthoniobacterales bacterium]
MKINLDDPNLTAFALGELRGPEAAEMEKAVAESAEAQTYVAETRQLAGMLRTEFRAELEDPKPLNILPLPEPRSFWSDAKWMSTAVAALLAICALMGAVLLSNRPPRQSRYVTQTSNLPARPAGPADVQMEVQSEPAAPAPPAAIARATPPMIANNEPEPAAELEA